MATDYEIAIASAVRLITDNNPACVARALMAEGYERKNFIPDAELRAALMELHIADRKKFFGIMKKCEWHYGVNNYTNKIREQIMLNVRAYTGKPSDKFTWWKNMIEFLESKSI